MQEITIYTIIDHQYLPHFQTEFFSFIFGVWSCTQELVLVGLKIWILGLQPRSTTNKAYLLYYEEHYFIALFSSYLITEFEGFNFVLKIPVPSTPKKDPPPIPLSCLLLVTKSCIQVDYNTYQSRYSFFAGNFAFVIYISHINQSIQ